MSISGRIAYQLAYEISPIILTGGLADSIPGGILPLVAITESGSFLTGLLSGNINTALDDFFAHYKPLPGSSLIHNQIGEYPFANRQVAANAIISQPLNVSMLMTVHPRNAGSMLTRGMVMGGIKSALDNHTANGGTFTILTPMYIYRDCVMTDMRDVSPGNSIHPQVEWQLDFRQPLISVSAAETVYSSLMAKMSSELPLPNPTWSGLASQVGKYASNAAGSAINSIKQISSLL